MATHKRSKHEYIPSTNGTGRVWDCYATKDRASGQIIGTAWESLPSDGSHFRSFDLFGCRKIKTTPCGMSRMTEKAEATAITLVKEQLFRDGLAIAPAPREVAA